MLSSVLSLTTCSVVVSNGETGSVSFKSCSKCRGAGLVGCCLGIEHLTVFTWGSHNTQKGTQQVIGKGIIFEGECKILSQSQQICGLVEDVYIDSV